mmetsp:Transcript_14039/g.20702  ORF Transcript_14039/g.20702 Transcript_14039/m.20702 type:complete len:212 (+) Transcript_14039:594-1229(+)
MAEQSSDPQEGTPDGLRLQQRTRCGHPVGVEPHVDVRRPRSVVGHHPLVAHASPPAALFPLQRRHVLCEQIPDPHLPGREGPPREPQGWAKPAVHEGLHGSRRRGQLVPHLCGGQDQPALALRGGRARAGQAADRGLQATHTPEPLALDHPHVPLWHARHPAGEAAEEQAQGVHAHIHVAAGGKQGGRVHRQAFHGDRHLGEDVARGGRAR